VARHAKATRVTISLGIKKGQVVLTVKDNGKGITEKEVFDPKSLGILGMKERAHIFGGEIRIAGNPGKGTAVTLSIPKSKPAEDFRGDQNPGDPLSRPKV
jgi:signal transduction histidine kinase